MRAPGPNEPLVDAQGRPTRVFAAFLRDVADEAAEVTRVQNAMIAQLITGGALPPGWSA